MPRPSRPKRSARKPGARAPRAAARLDDAPLRARFEAAVRRGVPGDAAPGREVGDAELAAFEARHGLTLPPDLRAHLRALGDGAVGFVRFAALEGRDASEYARASRPFRAPRAARGRPKPPNLDGTLRLGATAGGDAAYVVVTGSRAGEVWIDATARAGPFAKEGTFAELTRRWLEALEADARERDAVEQVAALGDQGARRVAGEAETRGLSPRAVARRILDEARASDAPDPAACEAAASILEAADQPALAALALALGGDWRGVSRIASAAARASHEAMLASSRPGDSGASAIDVATHLTHLVVAQAALAEPIALPFPMPDHARYTLVDTQTLPRVVERLPLRAQRVFFSGAAPAIAVAVFARSEPAGWSARAPAVTPALRALAAALGAGCAAAADVADHAQALAERLAVAEGEPAALGPALAELARVCALIGQAKEATACWQRCRALGYAVPAGQPPIDELMQGERDVALKLNVAAALIGVGAYDEAAGLCTQALAAGADKWTYLAHYDRGIARAALGDHQGAVQDFDGAIALAPGYAWAHNNLANACYALGDMARARAASRRSIELDPHNAPAYWVAANVCAAEGDRAGFFDNLERALKLGAKVWERLDKVHPRFAADRELAVLVAHYRR